MRALLPLGHLQASVQTLRVTDQGRRERDHSASLFAPRGPGERSYLQELIRFKLRDTDTALSPVYLRVFFLLSE